MKNAILIHGSCDKEEYLDDKYPSLSNSHWFPWLQKQLLINNISTQTPEMPVPYSPTYNAWAKEFERFDINTNTILVGHSCGGGFLVRWLSENKVTVNKIFLVAPWLDPSNRRTSEFFDFEIDGEMQDRIKEIHILVSTNEETEGVLESIDTIYKSLPIASVHKLNNMGHFTFDEMNSDKFPELLSLILK